MKALIASIVCLVVGLAIGFFVGYRYYERHITNEAVQQMLAGMESSQRLEAIMSIQAISLAESRDTQQVAQIFSPLIASFYSEYAPMTHNDKRTRDLLIKIEQFSRSNQVVAAQIRESTNAFFQLPSVWPNTAPEPTPTTP
jgi:uncharacterized protein YneF (UPF0154 family)